MKFIKSREASSILGGTDGKVKILLGTPPYNPIPDDTHPDPNGSTGPTNPNPPIIVFG